MKPFKIGIWIDESSYPQIGGGHSYTQKLINGIAQKAFDKNLEVFFVGYNLKIESNKPVISIPYKENTVEKKRNNILHKLFGIKIERTDIPLILKNAVELLKENDIQLLFYLTPHVQLNNYPYIITNWDLAHKSSYAFPEFSMNGQFGSRDYYFKKILNEALLICCESEQGKSEIEKAYGIEQNKIKILPMFAGGVVDNAIIDIKPNWTVDKTSFFLYPAQFWPHKNHYNLLLAFKDFLASSPEKKFRLILTGSDKGNLAYIKKVIEEVNLVNEVIIPGFVDNPTLKWLYKNAKGLVFPSFLGPTNMPLLEAKYLGCNIACSNLKGHHDLLGDDAIYFNPTDQNAIKQAMILLSKMDKTPQSIKLENAENEFNILEQIFLESIPVRRTWGQFDDIV